MRLYLGLVAAALFGFAGCGPTTAESSRSGAPESETASAGVDTSADNQESAEGSTNENAADAVSIPVDGDRAAAASAPSESTPSETASDGDVAAALPAPEGTPVPLEGGTANLSPQNTQVRFVCIHLPPKDPAPRTGTFEKFSGQATVADGTLKSLQIEFDTTSIWTDAGQRLTDHLKSADFFEVRDYPTAKFESTKVEATDASAGQYRITGNLTLHGETKEISFPARVQASDEGLALHAQFSILRSEFGMTYGKDAVDDVVKLTAIVGQPNKAE